MARHALLLGASAFPADPALQSLPGVRYDIDQLKALLDQAGQFDTVDVCVDAGRDQMVTTIEQFYGRRRFGDMALLYYSGHGLVTGIDSESLFLATTESDSRGSLHATAVDADGVLRHCLNTTNATQKVVLLDCCFSGSFELRNRFRGGVRQEPRRGLRERGTFVLTASTHTRAAKSQGDGRPSVFTGAVLDALRGTVAMSGSDAWVTTNDLARHVHQALRTFPPVESSEGVTEPIKLVETMPSARPHAVPRQDSIAGGVEADLDVDQWRRLIAYYRRALRRGAELSSFLQRMQRDTYVAAGGGPEAVLGGPPELQPPNPAFAAFAAKVGGPDRQIRYGYPILLLPNSAGNKDQRFAPLLVCDVTVSARGQVLASPPALNRAVAVELGLADPELDDLAQQIEETFVAGDRQALAETVRRLMQVLGLQSAGSMDPSQLTGEVAAGPMNRVQNTAILCAADPTEGAQGKLLEDLEVLTQKPNESLRSAAGALAEQSSSGERTSEPLTIVAPDRLNETQEQIIRSAMTERLTVAQGPPGTGKSQLVAALVATATAAGQTVLVGSTNNRAVDEVCQRIGALLGPGVLIRTGNRQMVAREPDLLRDLLQRGSVGDTPDVRTPAADLRNVATEITELRSALDLRRRFERDLADLAVERARLDPVEKSDEELLPAVRSAERAAAGGVFAWWWRWRLRSHGWSGQEPLADFAFRLTVELKWRSALREWTELPDVSATWNRLTELTAEARPQASVRMLSAQLQSRLRSGRGDLEARIRELSKSRTWAGFSNLLRTLPAWATTTMSARTLKPQPEIFDLVVIDEAAQCTIPAVLPMLFRARRVLVIGDPFQLSPVVTLPMAADLEAQREAGLSREWLERRQLSFGTYSAYDAFAAAAAGRCYLLDEHYRCQPRIIAVPNRHVYQNKLTVLTPPTAPAGDAVTWRHVTGTFSHGGSGSGSNRAEIEAVVDEVRQLQKAYPESSIGVVTPLAAHSWALDRALSRAGVPSSEVVRGTIHKFQGGERDIMVISPVGAHGIRRPTQNWLVNQLNLWNVAVTRARSRLVVVGDQDWWSGQRGLLPEVLRPDRDEDLAVTPHGAVDRLQAGLRGAGVDVARDQQIEGRRYDLLVGGKLLVQVDDPRGSADGRSLRRVLAMLDLKPAGHALIRVPVWRCLHDPDQVVEEVVSGLR